MKITYLHVMVRVLDLDKSIAFYNLLGLNEIRRYTSETGRFTLVYLAAPGQEETPVELTYNWDGDTGLPLPLNVGARNCSRLGSFQTL